MASTISLSEKQALLANIQGRSFLNPYYSGTKSDHLVSSSELDTTSSLRVFKSRSVIGKPDENYYTEGLPIWRAILLVVNAALGAGILNFPQAFAECGGISTGVTVQLGLLVFVTGAFLILAHCADKHGSQNFQEVVREVLGPGAYIAIQIFVMLYMFGSSIAYMILIGDQLEKVGEILDSSHPWYLGRKFLIAVVSIVFLLPLCLPKTLKVISYSSALGTLGAVYVCIVAAVKYYEGDYIVEPEFVSGNNLPWTGTFAAIPIICFGFQCHVPSVAVYAEMKKASVPKFAVVVIVAMAICSTAYTITGSFGYLTFGTTVKSDVLLNYRSNDVMVNVARIVLSVIVLSTSAVVLFCGRSCVEGMYLTFFRMAPGMAERHEKRRRITQTLIWFTGALIIAINVPSIGYAVALIGGLAALFIFFIPGLCLVQEMLQYPELTTKRKLLIALGITYVIMGAFIFADSEVLAIIQDITHKGVF